jgi:prevent-host-death family protein
MKMINIQEAKTHLSRLVDEVVNGNEEIVLAKANKPLVRLTPFRQTGSTRKGGQFAGQIEESADCWDAEDDPLGESADGPLYSRGVVPSGLLVAEDDASADAE